MRYPSLAHVLLNDSTLDNNRGINYIQNDNNSKYSSYNELFHNARRILNYLTRKGIKEGQELVLQIDDISSFVEVFWACILGKIIPVPVTTSINDEIRHKLFNIWGLLNDPWICISKSLQDNLEIFSKGKGYAKSFNQIKQRSILIDNIYDSETEAEIKEPSGSDIALIQFSSGSTGNPKGVIMTHRNLLINVEDIVTGFRPSKEEVGVSWMPLTHDMGLVGFHLVGVFGGWNHCLINPVSFVRNPIIWLEKIHEYKATMTASPNFGYKHLLKHFKPERYKHLDLSSVRLIFNGAEPISVPLCNEFLNTLAGFGLKQNVMFPVYGLAEAGLAVSFPIPGEKIISYKIDRNNIEIGKKVIFLDPQENGASFVSEGKSLDHCRIQIADNNNNPVADDVIGNICIKGDNVTSGYYNNETETKKTIDALGWLHTGDIGFIHNGCLAVTGRAKEIIFVNGRNYFPDDLERIIHEMKTIQEGKLFVTSINTENSSTDEILCFIVYKKSLDDFITLTSSINQWVLSKSGVNIHQFIPVEKIPKTSSGKIQRLQLRDAYQRGEYNSILRQISEIAEKKKPGINEIAGNEIEKKIIHIVQDVLKIEYNDIGIDYNFFDMGITSLSLIQIKSKIENEINRKIDDVTLFEHSTIRKLAAYIGDVTANDAKPVNVIRSSRDDRTGSEIAVIGMSCKFPGANSIDQFWDNLKNGIESISFFSDEELIEAGCSFDEIRGENYVKAKGIINSDQYFDSRFFEYTPRETEIIDPQMLVFLQCAWEALEDGSVVPELYGGKVGVFSGGSPNLEWQKQAPRVGSNNVSENFKTFLLIDKDFMSTWVSYKFNLKGPSVNIYTACSTSLVAVGMASSSLLHNECDIALAGGVSLHLPKITGYEYQEGMIFSKDGHVRTFDKEASGTVFSDGAGVVVLKRLKDALRDKNHIYAVILGADINNDGKDKVAFTAPGIQGQTAVIRNTIARAGVDPSTITYIENHGASTLLGDPIEIDSLKSVFDKTSKKYCGLGSVKTNIGHLDVAAGIAGFIKTALMLQYKQIPPSLNFASLNPKIDLDNTPFYVVDKLIDWKTSGFPLRAGISSFGIGGTNAHVILEEPPSMPPLKNEGDGDLICLSAKTRTALTEYIRKLGSYVNSHPDIDHGDLAYTLNKGRKTFAQRAMFFLKNQESLSTALSELGGIAYSSLGKTTKQIVFVFHREYSRNLSSGRTLFNKVDYFRHEIESCSERIKSLLGKDIASTFSRESNTAPEKGVDEIVYSQLAMFVFEYALARLLIKWGIKPSAMIGFDIGEYTAACLAGSIDFESAVKIISYSTELARKNIPPESELKMYLNQFDFHDPQIPCYSNSLGNWINPETLKDSFHRIDLKNQFIDFNISLSFFHGIDNRIFLGIGYGQELAAAITSKDEQSAEMIAFDLLPNQEEESGEFEYFLGKIGRIWLAGVDIDWRAYYEGREKNYLSLPGYAFEPVVRQNGFFTDTMRQPEKQISGEKREKLIEARSYLHPLLHQNTSDFEEHRYTSIFTGEEFFLKDHVVQGEKLLPAVALLEVARAAIEKSVRKKKRTIRLEKVTWAQPFIFSEKTREMNISLYPDGNDGISFKIFGNHASRGKETIFSQGSAILIDAKNSGERIDLASIIEKCNKERMTGNECYEAFSERGMSYGEGYRTLRELYLGEDQVIAKIEKNGELSESDDEYILHPGMMDGALQAVNGLMLDKDIKKPSLCFALDSIEVLSGCTEKMWSVIKFSDGYKADNNIQKYDIDICDESGIVCVMLRGYSSRVLEVDISGKQKVISSQEDAVSSINVDVSELTGELSLMPVWNPVKAESITPWPCASDTIAVIGGNPEQKMALKTLFPGMKILEIKSRDKIEEIANKLKEIDAIDHIFWLGSVNERISLQDGKSIRNLKIVQDQRKGVIQVFRLIKALLISGYGSKSLGWTIITFQTQAVNNKEEIDPTHAGTHGLIGSLAKEYPNWRIRLVDMPSREAFSIEEIATLPSDRYGNAIIYRNRVWYKQELVSIRDIGAGKDLYKVNGVYVVIGGAGGVGRVWSKWMIEKYGAKIFWLGRTAENDDIRAKICELGRLGPAPIYISADATNLESLQKAYEKIKDTYPKINGVIHSALVLKYQSLAKMEEDIFLAGLEAKVNVSVNLSIVFEEAALDFILFFSSIQTFSKSVWQSNYAAGCTFKDVYSYWLNQKLSCAVKVMNWGYWASDGAVSAKEYRETIAKLGMDLIEPDEGMPILEKFLASSLQQMVFVKTLKPMAIGGLTNREYISLYKENIQVTLQDLQVQLPNQNARRELLEKMAEPITASMDVLLYRLLLCQLKSLGMFSGNTFGMEDIPGLAGMPPFYKLWLKESIKLLTENNYLVKNNDVYTPIKSEDINAVWVEWEQKKPEWIKGSNNNVYFAMIEKCLKALPGILHRKVLATDILFPNSSMALVEGIYKGNAISEYFNEVLTDGAIKIIQKMINAGPNKGIRIFEIGAGTGATSIMLFNKLKMYEEHIKEYCYTDISKAFLMHAEKKYKGIAPYLNLQMFNVELPVYEQKIESGGYDLAIAANVLHATKNIRNTLRNAKAVLKGGGVLLLNEISKRNLFAHLTFGLLEGWWLSEDNHLRIPGSPGLYPASWQKVLEEEGFSEILFPSEGSHNLGQQIIAAVSDGVVRQAFSKAKDDRKNSREFRHIIRQDINTPYVAPRNTIEKDLVRLWEDLFGYDRIGINENFFDIGGDSINIIQFISKVANAGYKITLQTVYNHPTIAELSGYLEKENPDQNHIDGIIPLSAEPDGYAADKVVQQKVFIGEIPLTASQIEYLEQKTDLNWAGVSVLKSFGEELNLDLLEKSCCLILERHDILRAKFIQDSHGWRQILASPDEVTLPVRYLDYSAFSDEEQLEKLESLVMSTQSVMDLAKPPLINFYLVNRGKNRGSFLYILLHHIIFDAISIDILFTDITSIYKSFLLGTAPVFKDKPLAIYDWTDMLAKFVNNVDLEKEIAYWSKVFEKKIDQLPVDFPENMHRNRIDTTAYYKMNLSAEQTKALGRGIPMHLQMPLSNILIAGLTLALAEYSHYEWILINTIDFGRGLGAQLGVDLSRTVGWLSYSHYLLLRVDRFITDKKSALISIINQIKQVPVNDIRLLHYHKDDKKKEILSKMPKAQVCFNYLGVKKESHIPNEFDDYVDKIKAKSFWTHPENERSSILECITEIVNDELSITWDFSHELHKEETIIKLTESFLEYLRT